MRKLLILLAMLPMVAMAQLKIAVLDTGKPINPRVPVCATGHIDYTSTTINDTHGHSSHVSDLVFQYAGTKTGYCLTFFKYYLESQVWTTNQRHWLAALKHISEVDFDVLMVAGGGQSYSYDEGIYIKRILNKGVVIVAAAGNEMTDLDITPYYPAYHDDRIVVVGGITEPGTRRFNDGSKVDRYEKARNVSAIVNGREVKMSGTSQATGIATGKIVKGLLRK